MASEEKSADWIWWAIPLLLVLAAAAWLILGGDDASNFGYEID